MTIRACVLRIEGTNCELETARALELAGAEPELVHLKQLEHSADTPRDQWRSLLEYHILVIPGGFSAGDSVRAGAILAARMKSTLAAQLRQFVEQGRPVGGICNGFQVLVELGLLPGLSALMTDKPEACLSSNASGRFECRPVLLAHVNRGNCAWTRGLDGEPRLMPVAHGEGRFLLAPGKEQALLDQLITNDQIVFRYARPDGSPAEGAYPHNPNGALYDIAGICNRLGNVMGMMPHPERVCDRLLNPDWTRKQRPRAGLPLFEAIVRYAGDKVSM